MNTFIRTNLLICPLLLNLFGCGQDPLGTRSLIKDYINDDSGRDNAEQSQNPPQENGHPAQGAPPGPNEPESQPEEPVQPLAIEDAIPPIAQHSARSCDEIVPPAFPMRRLTGREYFNTIRQNFNIWIDWGNLVDDPTHPGPSGFTNDGTLMTTSELSVENLLEIGSRIKTYILDNPWTLSCREGQERACLTRFINERASRLFRRPLTQEEAAILVQLYEDTAETASNFEALATVIQATIQMPQVWYLSEVGEPVEGDPDLVRLTPYELAARMAYFLTDSPPDDALYEDATTGRLRDPVVLEGHARRLLNTAPAYDTIELFHRDWLELYRIENLQKDAQFFDTEFYWHTDSAMSDSLLRFVRSLAENDRLTMDGLFNSREAHIDLNMAVIYGMEGDAFADVDWGADADGNINYGQVYDRIRDDVRQVELPMTRAGILTRPAFLAGQSHFKSPSPVLRGAFVLKNILCVEPGSPPPEAEARELANPKAPTRERLAEHRSSPACQGCHSMIDPLGLTFEGFDAIGMERERERHLMDPHDENPNYDTLPRVDTTGGIPFGDVAGPVDGAVELSEQLSQSQTVADCVTTQWFRYATGRKESVGRTNRDRCMLDNLKRRFTESGYNVKELLVAIVTEEGFQYRLASDVQ